MAHCTQILYYFLTHFSRLYGHFEWGMVKRNDMTWYNFNTFAERVAVIEDISNCYADTTPKNAPKRSFVSRDK